MELLAFGCIAIITYTYAGYPLVVEALSRLRPWRPDADPSYEPSVSVCVAAHDGAAHLERKLRELSSIDYPKNKLEILVYSDGSTDDTEAIVERFTEHDGRVRLLKSAERRGKPSAINELRRAARGDVLLMTDVRPTLAQNALRPLIRTLADPTVGCVSGTLVLAGAAGSSAYWRYEQFIRSREARLGSLVGVSGTIYAIRREDLDDLPPDVLLDDMWVPLRLALEKKSRIALCEEAEAHDQAFEDSREFGRKVRTLAGNFQLISLLPSLLSPRANPVWFQMVSHKLMRLLCPFALVILFFASIALAIGPDPGAGSRWVWQLLLSGQLAFYFLAAAGERAGRLGRLARTFVVLNVAAVVGLWRFARGSQSVTW